MFRDFDIPVTSNGVVACVRTSVPFLWFFSSLTWQTKQEDKKATASVSVRLPPCMYALVRSCKFAWVSLAFRPWRHRFVYQFSIPWLPSFFHLEVDGRENEDEHTISQPGRLRRDNLPLCEAWSYGNMLPWQPDRQARIFTSVVHLSTDARSGVCKRGKGKGGAVLLQARRDITA